MASPSAIQSLIETRNKGLKAASEKRDADELMTWQAEDTVFENPAQKISLVGKEAVRNYYANVYKAMPNFQVLESKATGYTPEFVAAEMKCEGVAGSDMPQWGVKQGDILDFIGVSLFWWRWEGPGEAWDGSLTDEAVRGWKITREHVYINPSKRA